MKIKWLLVALAMSVGCSDSSTVGVDAGDGGASSNEDAGSSSNDDAGSSDEDAGSSSEEDAGSSEEDAGSSSEEDAGSTCECAHGSCSFEEGVAVCDCAGTGYVGSLCDEVAPVSVSFDDHADLGSTLAAGQTPTVGWVDALGRGAAEGDGGALSELLDESGAASGVSLSWSCQDIEITSVTGGTEGDRAMMADGCRSWLGAGDASVTLEGLSTHFPEGYRLVVYVGHGGGNPPDHEATFTLDVGSEELTGHVLASFDGTFDLLENGGDGGNYYETSAMGGDSVTLSLAATGNATLPTAAINGIQIFPATAPATGVAVSFDDSARIGASDAAGVSPEAGWNNARGRGTGEGDGGMLDLLDAYGRTSGVAVAWACQDVEVTTITGGGAGDRAMMSNGCRSWFGMGDASMTFTGLSTLFPSGYRVYVYVGRGGGTPPNHNASFTLEVGSTTVTGKVQPTFDGTYTELAGDGAIGNYFESEVLTADELDLGLAATGNATLPTAAINGVQLVPAS